MIRALLVLGALAELGLARVLPETGVSVYPRLAAALVVLLLPGGLVAEALGRRSASATVLWSFAAVGAALGAAFLLDGSVDLALLLLALVAAAALPFAHRRARPPRIPGSAAVAAAGILFGLALWHVAGHVDGDGLFHLARIRKLLAFDGLELSSVNEFADGGLHPGYAFPLWHGFVALLARLAGVDPELALLHAPSVLAPLAFLVSFEAGAVLFRSSWLGVSVLAGQLAQIAFAAGHGGAYATLASPGTVSRQLLVPAILTLVFTHLRDPDPAVLAGIAVGAVALTVVHPTYALFLAVPLAGFLLARLPWSRADARRLADVLVAFVAPTGAVVLALLPVARETVSRNPGPVEAARGLAQYGAQIDVTGGGSFRLAPEMIARGGSVAVLALALVPLAALAARRRWAAWVLGGALPVLCLMLVPELFTRLSDAVSLSQSRRAAGFVPFAFAFAGGLAVLAAPLRAALPPLALGAGIALQHAYPGDFTLKLGHGGGPGAVAWWAVLAGAAALVAAIAVRRPPVEARGPLAAAAAVLFVLPTVAHAAARWSASSSRLPSPLTPGLVDALRERVPAGSVVFSDLETSYRVGAAAPLYVAANPPAHVANTTRNRPYERRDEVLRFFRHGNVEVARRAGAQYLLLDRRKTGLRPALPRVYADGRYLLLRL